MPNNPLLVILYTGNSSFVYILREIIQKVLGKPFFLIHKSMGSFKKAQFCNRKNIEMTKAWSHSKCAPCRKRWEGSLTKKVTESVVLGWVTAKKIATIHSKKRDFVSDGLFNK